MQANETITKSEYIKNETIIKIIEKIKEIDIQEITPIQALNTLLEMKCKIKEMEKRI